MSVTSHPGEGAGEPECGRAAAQAHDVACQDALGTVARQTARLAHDFNNALTSILGFSEWLLSENDAGHPGRFELNHIHASAVTASRTVQRLQQLVAPYLHLGRPEAIAARATDCVRGLVPLSVLVVDDQPDVRDSLSRMLDALGHRPVVAGGGESAIELLSRNAFDVVVTDLSMPEVDGLAVARHAARVRPAARVVLLTGWGSDHLQAAEGVSLVLAKPITQTLLADALAQLVSRAA